MHDNQGFQQSSQDSELLEISNSQELIEAIPKIGAGERPTKRLKLSKPHVSEEQTEILVSALKSGAAITKSARFTGIVDIRAQQLIFNFFFQSSILNDLALSPWQSGYHSQIPLMQMEYEMNESIQSHNEAIDEYLNNHTHMNSLLLFCMHNFSKYGPKIPVENLKLVSSFLSLKREPCPPRKKLDM